MRLEVQRDTGIVGQPLPAFDLRHAFGHRMRPHVGLQVQVVRAELGHVLEDRLQIVDRARITLRLPGQALLAQLAGHLARIVAVEEAHAGAVEASARIISSF